MHERNRLDLRSALLVILAAAAGGGCGEEKSPAGPSVTISAPTLVSPAGGSEVNDDQPTLTVGNSTVSDGSTPTYTFQVATDSAFNGIVAQAAGVPQNAAGGQTSWEVSTPLANAQHFWRARARAATTDGPFSPAADFTVRSAFKSDEPRAGLLVFDPLTTGSSVGEQRGGEFTPKGWKVISRSNFIAYDVPSISSGFLEVDITALTLRNISPESRMIFIMWDPTRGDFTTNPFRVSVQKLDRRSSVTTKYIRLRWITNGEQHDAGNSFIGWDPETIYHWRMEWGPEGEVNAARVLLQGQEIMYVQYRRDYRPALHRIELGAAPRAESLEEAIFSNVRIGVRQ